MDAIKLGPPVVPMQVALLLASRLLANEIAAWFHRAQSLVPGPILWKMTLIGFGLARLIFVLRHHDVYIHRFRQAAQYSHRLFWLPHYPIFCDAKGRLESPLMDQLSAATLEDRINQLLDVR